MSGKGSKMTSYPWLCAYNVLFNNGEISYDEGHINESDSQKEVFLLQSTLNQEDDLFKKQLILNLSDESKDIIKLIFSSTFEVMNLIKSPKYDCVSKDRIYEFLRRCGWKRRKIQMVFKELRDYVMKLED